MIPSNLVLPSVGNRFIDVPLVKVPNSERFLMLSTLEAQGLTNRSLFPTAFASKFGAFNAPTGESGYPITSIPAVKNTQLQPVDNTSWKNMQKTDSKATAPENTPLTDTLLTDAEKILASQDGSEMIMISRRNLLLLILIVVLAVILVSKLLK